MCKNVNVVSYIENYVNFAPIFDELDNCVNFSMVHQIMNLKHTVVNNLRCFINRKV